MATKNFYIGPQDGWVAITTDDPKVSLRVSASIYTHPLFVYGDETTPPTAATVGVRVCHKPFYIENQTTAGNTEVFYVKVPTPVPNSTQGDGRLRVDVYCDGGTLT